VKVLNWAIVFDDTDDAAVILMGPAMRGSSSAVSLFIYLT
jgi:hypothetical protein